MTLASMRACVITQPGGPEVLQLVERPIPSLRPGDVLIRVAAAGVNGADLLQRRGKYAVPEGVSAEIPGLEAAGMIIAVTPEVHQWKVGDAVTALLTGGGYAEYVAVPAGQCLPWPELPEGQAAMEQAAALPETCCTVWSNVFEIGALKPGERLLVHGGASGIGTTAIQLASAMGAMVFCTVGSESKKSICLELGATAVFNYKTEDFVAGVHQQTQGKGVDVLLDIVGGNYLQRNLDCLGHQGRLVILATRGGARAELDIGLLMRKQACVTGSLLRPRSVSEKTRLVSAVQQHIWPLVKQGKCKPVIDLVVPLADASRAHARLESGDHIGKVVLTTDHASSRERPLA